MGETKLPSPYEFENYLTDDELAEWASSDPRGFAAAYRDYSRVTGAPGPQDGVLEQLDWNDWLELALAAGTLYLTRRPFGVNPPRMIKP